MFDGDPMITIGCNVRLSSSIPNILDSINALTKFFILKKVILDLYPPLHITKGVRVKTVSLMVMKK
jgi:hypothetical protein